MTDDGSNEAEHPKKSIFHESTFYDCVSMQQVEHADPLVRLDLAVATPEWAAIDDVSQIVAKAIDMAIIESGSFQYLKPLDTVSVLLSDDKELQNLNSIYRGQYKPTNVLSFPYVNIKEAELPMDDIENNIESYERIIGDIAISYQTIKNEALEYSKSLSEHLSHMVVHGMLHLLQYDHQSPNEAAIMEEIEINCMHNLGYKDFEYEPIADYD